MLLNLMIFLIGPKAEDNGLKVYSVEFQGFVKYKQSIIYGPS